MKYSVIVPVYNAEKYLRRCIDSVIAQTFSDWQLLLINDGSSDSSPSICDAYQAMHPERVQVVHQENCGVLCARRVGIGHAQGEYLCFLDSDDYWDAHLLEEIDSFHAAYDPDIIVFGYRKVGPQGEALGEELPSTAIRLYESEEMALVYEKMAEGKLSCLWAQVVKRTVVDFARDYSPYYSVFKGEDMLQNLAFLDKASKVLFLPTVYISYFINIEGLSHRKISIPYLNSHVIVQEQLLAYMEKWGMPLEKSYQMFIGVFNMALKALMLNNFIDSLYTKSEVDEILMFLSTDIRFKYLEKTNIDWQKKRLGLSLWFLKRKQIGMLKGVLFVCRILNGMKNIVKPGKKIETNRKGTNVQN